jgi:hypothetical protein
VVEETTPQPTKPAKAVPTDADLAVLTVVSAAQKHPTKRHAEGCSYLVKRDGTAAVTRTVTAEELASLATCNACAGRVVRARVAGASVA